jgi:hypothetical protein
MTIEKIKKEFPNIRIVDLKGGCNVYLPGKLVITIWFKKKKFYSNKLKVWRNFVNDDEIIHIICVLGNLQLKTDKSAMQETSGNQGTQACIDHLQRKYEVIQKSNPYDHKLLSFCQSLKHEFEQYL